MQSNYEITKHRMEEEFLRRSQETMIARHRLAADADWLYFTLFAEECRVSRRTGRVECRDFGGGMFREADYNEAMTAFALLCREGTAAPAGEYVNMKSLSRIQSASPGLVRDSLYGREAKLFDGHFETFRDVLAELGGEFRSSGDLCAALPVFDGMKVLVRLWRADDEFEAQLQLLWDANVLAYMHYETVWYAGSVLMKQLRRSVERKIR